MKCSMEGYPGEYEQRPVLHIVRRNGRVIVIDHVPAEVCSFCGDVLFGAETVRRIETILATQARPAGTASVYEYV